MPFRSDPPPSPKVHRMPFGAELQPDGSVAFRIYAPGVPSIQLEIEGAHKLQPLPQRSPGWFRLTTAEASAGSLYRFVLPDGTRVPDPASRFQPRDLSGPSQVMDPTAYVWNCATWKGRPWHEAILYELHIGTFTPHGTFSSATSKLDHLADLGITAIELMSVADFAGNRNWGYDGVLLYAPDSAYGQPDDMKAFIDAAHARGILVILDVVYNHFGPEGDFMPEYFPQIRSDRHNTPWGRAFNFDAPGSAEVREFVIQNALYWIEEFQLDGLRLDASHAIIDESPKHVLDELRDRVEAATCGRPIHLILEHEQNISQRLRRDALGKPTSYTAQWNHDITHLLAAVLGKSCDDRTQDDSGETDKLSRAISRGFVIAAEESGRDNVNAHVPPTAYIDFIQTHDLIGNRIFGDRLHSIADPAAVRAIAAILLLSPQIPLLFMGQEWAASTPFPFFSDYHGELAEAVRKGRCDQLAHQDPAPSPEELARAPNPQAESTLRSAQLRWDELNQPEHATWFQWYRRILAVRTREIIPLLSDLTDTSSRYEVLGPGVFHVSWKLQSSELHLAANLCSTSTTAFPQVPGRELWTEGEQQGSNAGPWSIRWTIGDQTTES